MRKKLALAILSVAAMIGAAFLMWRGHFTRGSYEPALKLKEVPAKYEEILKLLK